MTLPKKPPGCRIEEEAVNGRLTLRWRSRMSRVYQHLHCTLLCVWLCGWTIGMVMGWSSGIRQGVSVFGVFGLVGGTLVAAFGYWRIWCLLWWGRPESIRLDEFALRFIPEHPFGYQLQTGKYYRGRGASLRRLLFPGEPAEVDRSEILELKLDRVGERQRLYFQTDMELVEIGSGLQETDRHWLFLVLEHWRHGGTDELRACQTAGSREVWNTAMTTTRPERTR